MLGQKSQKMKLQHKQNMSFVIKANYPRHIFLQMCSKSYLLPHRLRIGQISLYCNK